MRKLEDFLELIDECLDDDDFLFAEDTLKGIKDTVSRTQTVTERQLQAVNNIRNAVENRKYR